MVLKTWDFIKDRKSTKVPDTEGTEVNIKLKENTSITTPTFILSFDTTPVFTYCQYMFYYYFVEDITFLSNNQYEVHCNIDVLATYREDILSSTQYILRSASDYDVLLDDNVFEPQQNGIITMTQSLSNLNKDGVYIVKYGSSTSAQYGVTYRCGTKTEIGNFIKGCYDLNNWQNLVDITFEKLQKTVFDFSQYIQEIYWLPVAISDIENQYSIVPFVGAWQITSGEGGTKEFLDDYYLALGTQITIPNRYYNDYRDYEKKFTQFLLDIPGVGSINIDPREVYKGLEIQYAIDLKTGDAKHAISTSDGVLLTTIRCNYKVPVSYATFNNNFVKGANQVIEGVTGVFTSAAGVATGTVAANMPSIGGNLGNYAQNFGGVISGLVELGSITTHMCNAQGSMADINTNNYYSLTRYVYNCAEQPLLNIGRKLHQYRQLSSLSGYCQCLDAILNTDAYGQIKQIILDYMNNGFIIE